MSLLSPIYSLGANSTGKYELVMSPVTISGAAVATYDFSNLNLALDGGYLIEGTIITAGTPSGDLKISPDAADTNCEFWGQTNYKVAGYNRNFTYWFLETMDSTVAMAFSAEIRRGADNRALFNLHFATRSIASGDNYSGCTRGCGLRWNTNNVTSLRIGGGGAGTIGVGSTFYLYRLGRF